MLFVWRRRPAAPPWPRPACRLARLGPGLSLSVCLPGCVARLPSPALLLLYPVWVWAGQTGAGQACCVSTRVSQCQWSRVVSCVCHGGVSGGGSAGGGPFWGEGRGYTTPARAAPSQVGEEDLGAAAPPPTLTPHTQSLGVKVLPRAVPGRPVLQGRRAAGGRPCPRRQGGRHWSSYGTC